MNWQLFEERVAKRMEEEHIPGMAIAVSQHGKTIYENGFGVRDMLSNKPATPETLFGTASITKSFTALAIMKLVETGTLSLDDSVSTYLSSFHIRGIESIEEVTIHHLLTHTTGLAPIERKEEHQQFIEHLTYLSKKTPDLVGQPGEFFSYSNDAFLLLGAIIEKVTGRLYRRFIMEEIIYPLQMNRSTFSLEEVQKMCNVAAPYVYSKEKKQHLLQEWLSLGVYEVGGGLRSSARDLMKYGDLFLTNGKIKDESLISPSYLKKMYQPHVNIDTDLYYGYGLKVTPDYHGVTLVEHSGGQPGVSSNFGFIPEKNCSIAILMNVSGASARDVWFDIVHVLFGIPFESKSKETSPKTMRSQEVNRFLGRFSSGEGDQVTITKQAESLLATHNGEMFHLELSDTDDVVRKKGTDQPIRFFFKADGTAWAILIGMRMLLRRN